MKFAMVLTVLSLSMFAHADCFKLSEPNDLLPSRFCFSPVELVSFSNGSVAKFLLDDQMTEREVYVEDATNEGKISVLNKSEDGGACERSTYFNIEATLSEAAKDSRIVVVTSLKATTMIWTDSCHTKHPAVNEINYVRE